MSAFRFRVEKVFLVRGRGVVVSGKMEEGRIAVEQVVGFLEATGRWKSAAVLAIEVEQELVEEAKAGQQASLLLDGVKKNQIPAGTILLEPPRGAVAEEDSYPEEDARTPVRPALPSSPQMPGPASGPSGRPIEPDTGSWRLAILILLGVLIVLGILFFQGKLDPLKRRVGIGSCPPPSAASFAAAGDPSPGGGAPARFSAAG